MANKNNNPGSFISNMSKRQASKLNKDNRNISGNINSILDTLHNMTYGVQRVDKSDAIINQFNSLLKTEIDSITKTADGDVTSFITKLFSENNKRMSAAMDSLDELFNMNEGQMESFLTDQYKNRMIKQADLHEVASQLVELKEAINITRDAIISPDIIDGHMSRTITFDINTDDDREDYLPIIEKMEEKFKLQEKIKNFIIPRSLEYGEYYTYCLPYSKIFEDFEREYHDGKYSAYREAYDSTINLGEFVDSKRKKDLLNTFTEAVREHESFGKTPEQLLKMNTSNFTKEISKEMDMYLENIEVNNSPLPLMLLEESIDSYREYYKEFCMEKSFTEKPANTDAFRKVMGNIIDTGIYDSKSTKAKKENFDFIHDCYIKLMDPMHLIPIEIMDETLGYYYIQEEEINPLSGILTSTMYYDRYDQYTNKNTVLDAIADTVVASFDKKFLKDNIKFKKLIVEALTYHKLNTKRIKFQFIPKEYVIPFKINEDENGHGTSIIEQSLFYAKLYLMILLFKIMTIILNSNDTKVNYLRQSGIDLDIKNKIDEIVRLKQIRQINLADMFSYTTLINKIGSGAEMYVPVGRNDVRGIETEILSGQDVQLNTELMEMLKKAYISGTGVPDVLMNYINEADFAKTLELANNRFQGRVVSYQLDYNSQITKFYKAVAKYSTNIPDEVVELMEFNFIQPKYQNSNISNDLINNTNALLDFMTTIYFGQDAMNNPDYADKIMYFRRELAKERLSMLNFDNVEKIFKKSEISGTEALLDPSKGGEEEV